MKIISFGEGGIFLVGIFLTATTDILIKYKIFYIKKQEFFAYQIFQTSSLFLYIS